MIINDEKKLEYKEQGIIIIKNFVKQNFITEVKQELISIIESKLNNSQINEEQKISKDIDNYLSGIIKKSFVPNTELREFLYEHLKHINSFKRMCYSDDLENILKQLGFTQPMCFEFPTIRFDLPKEDKYLTRAHQDLRSIRGKKCATIWFPLVDVNIETGTIGVFPKTHNQGIIQHEINDGQLEIVEYSKRDNYLALDSSPGDLIIMNSFCIHKSIMGTNDNVKVNGQVFWNDMSTIDINDEYYALRKIPDAKIYFEKEKL